MKMTDFDLEKAGRCRAARRWLQRAASLAGLAALLTHAGCGGATGSAGTALAGVDCSAAVPTYAELTIWPLCTVCHASSLTGTARQRAPSNINFDTYAAAAAAATEAAAQVNAGEMPPPGQTQPTADQKTALYRWASCGQP